MAKQREFDIKLFTILHRYIKGDIYIKPKTSRHKTKGKDDRGLSGQD